MPNLEFAISRDALSEELTKLLSVISKKVSIPILECIHIISDGQNLKLTATNMETTIFSEFSSSLLAVTQQGSMCVPAKKLSEIVRNAYQGPIKISSNDNHWVTVITKSSRYKIAGLNPENWPELPSTTNHTWLKIPAQQLKVMLQNTRYAISTEESRANIRGAKLEIDTVGIRMVTTDGNRMTLTSAALPEALAAQQPNFEVLIPSEAFEELSKLATDNSGEIGIAKNESTIFFQINSKIISSRLLVGKFPNYQLPYNALNSYLNFGTFKCNELSQAIKQAVICSTKDSDKATGVVLNFEPGALKLSAKDADIGEANVSLESNFNTPLRVFCSGKYLTDYLDPLGSEEVKIEIKDNVSQIYLSTARENIGIYGLLMPMMG